MRETAFAKLNLALHVRGRQPDGYHGLETIFAFVEEGDRLQVESGEGLSLRVEGPFAAALAGAGDNLVHAAARLLAERFGVDRGAALILDKRLPVAAGIGGGSADAAAALRLLDRFWGLDAGEAPLLALARQLGADVPVCLLSRPCRGTGRGDALTPLDAPELRAIPVLLVNPGVPLSTAAVFRAWDGPASGPLGPDPFGGANDLEGPAIALVPEIEEVLEALRGCAGARLVRMSGSGATCFALFGDEAERDSASRRIAAARPGWWRLASRLR
ncbi:MAG TPA: 4-(cytidine 5'-diphospho)-2-C-methyl-D-erythritol kinase [Allosphingosinicella sp.]|jgi:4-diphosphocytidyl-2-C-methyl-D-erythritol kinase